MNAVHLSIIVASMPIVKTPRDRTFVLAKMDLLVTEKHVQVDIKYVEHR